MISFLIISKGFFLHIPLPAFGADAFFLRRVCPAIMGFLGPPQESLIFHRGGGLGAKWAKRRLRER